MQENCDMRSNNRCNIRAISVQYYQGNTSAIFDAYTLISQVRQCSSSNSRRCIVGRKIRV